MKVLNELPEGTNVDRYKFLSTKVVYDWRHRDNEWQRRGRLVAREFKWLGSTDIASLFSPTGVASTVKLLSAMFVSSNDRILGSIDVGDAYLMVEQEEPTVVEVDGKYYELGFTLPGQRIGSSAWFNKLKGYLEEYGYATKEEFQELIEMNGNGRTGNGRRVSEGKLTKIIQAVTMAVLVALGEAKKFGEEEENGKDEGLTVCMRALIVLIGCVCCYLIPVAAVLRIKRLKVEGKRRREGMAEEAHSE
ncbi:unnamed protein product, partial [Symbiodinium natans]